jgi:PPK2 family polyphosphate:nucleotide phosphotransferase
MTGIVFDRKGKRVRLDEITAEPPKGMTRAKAEERFKELGRELFELQDKLWGAKTRSVMVVLQGRDSAGKDGAIKHVVGFLNPRGVAVTSFGVPTEEERDHDFLGRVHQHAPRKGEFAIFNRSHYEDVLVVRVHDFVPKGLWKERYGHIADFEELLHEHGTIILKFFLHISSKEQEARLLEREAQAETAWKLNPGDWKERGFWDEYSEAYEEAIERTASPAAPWIVVPANAKWYRNLVVAEAIVDALRPHKKEFKKKLDEMGAEGKAELDRYRRSLRAAKAAKRRTK